MPRTTTRKPSTVPSLLLGAGGILLGAQLLHDLVDRRLLTADSIFDSPLIAVLAALGVAMGGVLAWDFFTDRRPR
jgi:hypothetical protein